MRRDPREKYPEVSALRDEVAQLARSLAAEPERYYGSPSHLAWDVRLTRSQRIKALKAWYRRASDTAGKTNEGSYGHRIVEEIDAALKMTRAQEF